MERTPDTLTVSQLMGAFVDIDFPEYQREPDVWSLDQKQKLIDSILRRFDVASLYFFWGDDGALECIDGRQRINAIMSFVGLNPEDEYNGFRFRAQNEVSDEAPSKFQSLSGVTFAEMQERTDPLAVEAVATVLEYPLTVIYLSGELEPDEFNLQFLRLNLGTLINAGEKLHAMVGTMHDLIFKSARIGKHPFLQGLRVPTRRFAKEQVAAHVLLQAFSRSKGDGAFARSRHFDLQRFLKEQADVSPEDPTITEIEKTLDALHVGAAGTSQLLRNRSMAVSVVLLAWDQKLYADADKLGRFHGFLEDFVGRLRWQVDNMRRFDPDENYPHLVDFQRHLTQASVERPAVAQRHEMLTREWLLWLSTGELTGDAEYRAATGKEPPVRPFN